MDAAGGLTTLVELSDGPNPIVVVPVAKPRGVVKPPPAGLYVADTASRAVLFAPASRFAPFRGQVIVGSEIKGLFWVVRPSRSGFTAEALTTNLRGGPFNFEGATYIN
jgi:hypothetical protein